MTKLSDEIPWDERDALVRDVLEERGDDGTTPRETFFFFYEGDQEGLRAAAAAAGYDTASSVSPNGSTLRCVTAVDEATFDSLTAQMLDWAEAYGARYDGWEAQLLVN